MTRPLSYSPQTVELDHSLKPFIPDFIPAVGDIDAFLKVQTGSDITSPASGPIRSWSKKNDFICW